MFLKNKNGEDMENSITTVCKARLSIADIDRHYYQSHKLTIAQQSTETIHQSMLRLLAYIYNANDRLRLCKQPWKKDHPELIEQSIDDEIHLWIDLGQPNFKRVKKACRLSKKVIIYTNKHVHNDNWWDKNKGKLNHFKNLSVYAINAGDIEKINNKRMTLDCTLQDGELQINDGDHHVMIERKKLM